MKAVEYLSKEFGYNENGLFPNEMVKKAKYKEMCKRFESILGFTFESAIDKLSSNYMLDIINDYYDVNHDDSVCDSVVWSNGVSLAIKLKSQKKIKI